MSSSWPLPSCRGRQDTRSQANPSPSKAWDSVNEIHRKRAITSYYRIILNTRLSEIEKRLFTAGVEVRMWESRSSPPQSWF